MGSSLEEVHELYQSAIGRSILDYALHCSSVTQRLKLEALAPFMSLSKAQKTLYKAPLFICIPEHWKQNYSDNKRIAEKSLYRYRRSVMMLRDTWMSSFQNRSLLQSPEDLNALMPLELSAFKQIQVTSLSLLLQTVGEESRFPKGPESGTEKRTSLDVLDASSGMIKRRE